MNIMESLSNLVSGSPKEKPKAKPPLKAKKVVQNQVQGTKKPSVSIQTSSKNEQRKEESSLDKVKAYFENLFAQGRKNKDNKKGQSVGKSAKVSIWRDLQNEENKQNDANNIDNYQNQFLDAEKKQTESSVSSQTPVRQFGCIKKNWELKNRYSSVKSEENRNGGMNFQQVRNVPGTKARISVKSNTATNTKENQNIKMQDLIQSKVIEDLQQLRNLHNKSTMIQKQPREFNLRIQRDRSQQSLNKKYLSEVSKQRIQEQEKRNALFQQELHRNMEEKKKKVLEKYEEQSVKQQQKIKQQQNNTKRIHELREKKLISQKIEEKYCDGSLMPILQQRKKRLKQLRNPTKPPISQQPSSLSSKDTPQPPLPDPSDRRSPRRSVLNYLSPHKADKQYTKMRQKRIERILEAGDLDTSAKISQLQAQTQKLEQQQRQLQKKQKLSISTSPQQDTDRCASLLLASIKAKMGIIQVYNNNHHNNNNSLASSYTTAVGRK